MRAALIGCGNIGTALAELLEKQKTIKLAALVDENISAAWELRRRLKINRPVIMDMGKAIAEFDLIIEAASPPAVKKILAHIIENKYKKKLLVVSTGGLIGRNDSLKKLKGCEIYIPSGAIAGLDSIKAVAGEIDSLELITTKPAGGLQGSPFAQKHGLNLSSYKKKTVIFEGNIFEAVKNFPQNINVAASLFLASQFKKIKVRIVADPQASTNSHEVICIGKFGTIHTVTRNLPSKNPKTSYLAVLSAQSALRNIFNPVKTGC